MTTRTHRPGWKEIDCAHCRGYGVVGVGIDQLPDDCPKCGGKGFLFQTPKGHFVEYPGGPFVG